jgi:hypothetical protein
MVRPRMEKFERKSRKISFRLTEAEFVRLTHRAAAADLPVHQLARDLTMMKVKRLVVKRERRHDPVLIKQLYAIGVNLNQLTKNAHIFKRVSPKVEDLCFRIEALMNEALGEEEGK